MSDVDKRLAEVRLLIEAKAGDLNALQAERRELKRQKWPTKCCRCWPSSINVAGYCGCCDYDHVTSKRETFADPTPEVKP